MLYDELPIPFPWFDKREKQDRYRKNCGHGVIGRSAITPKDCILPFQIRKPQESVLPSAWIIVDADSGVTVANLDPEIPFLVTHSKEGWDYITWLGNTPMVHTLGDLDLPSGCYESRMTFPGGVWYSETFSVPVDRWSIQNPEDCNYLTLTWWDDTDIRPILFFAGGDNVPFKLRCYLDSEITASEPEVDEETEKNGDEIEVPIQQRMIRKFRVSDVVTEHMKVALVAMQIMKHKEIATEKSLRTGEMIRVEVSAEVEVGGCQSAVEILFEQDLVMIRRTCVDEMADSPCPAMPPTPSLNIAMQYLDPVDALMTATIPPGMAGEVVRSMTQFGAVATASPLSSPADFVAGVEFGHMGWNWFGLRLKTFSCTVGVTPRGQIPGTLPVWEPDDIPGLSLWWRGDDNTTHGGGLISEWEDKIMTEYLNPHPGGQVQYSQNVLNGHAILTFNGEPMKTTNQPVGFSDFHIFIVMKADPFGSTPDVFFENAGNFQIKRDGASTDWGLSVDGGDAYVPITGQWQIIDAYRTGAFITVQDSQNMVGSSNFVNQGVASSGEVYLGSASNYPSTNGVIDFEVAEILIYDHELSGQDYLDVIDYLDIRYNL